jgi:sulfur-carrier protein
MSEPTPTIEVTVQFFAVLREQAGVSEAAVSTAARDVGGLYTQLSQSHGLRFPFERLRVAVNQRYVPNDAPLAAGDRVVYIPPVAGG